MLAKTDQSEPTRLFINDYVALRYGEPVTMAPLDVAMAFHARAIAIPRSTPAIVCDLLQKACEYYRKVIDMKPKLWKPRGSENWRDAVERLEAASCPHAKQMRDLWSEYHRGSSWSE
jgi:hypothetical protein